MLDKHADIPLVNKILNLVKVRNYVDNLYEKPDLRQLFIELTLNCNEHCRHCGSRCGDLTMQDQLTDKEILEFLKDLKSKVDKAPFLNVTGGEPMLRPNFYELMHSIREMGYGWGMTTNGTLIKTAEDVERLKWAGLKSISISIDGLEETHDWFRQTKNGYNKSMKAINLLVDGGIDNIMITTVIHKKNINEIEEMYEVVKNTGVTAWRIINVDPIGRAKDNREIMLDKDDYIKMIKFIKENRPKEDSFEICFGCNYWLGVDNEHKLRNWYYRCEAGLRVAGICYNGDISACLDIERNEQTIQGNIRKDDFLDTWKNKFKIYRFNRAYSSDYCKGCTECGDCRGNGFHTWNLKENKPELCLYKQCILEDDEDDFFSTKRKNPRELCGKDYMKFLENEDAFIDERLKKIRKEEYEKYVISIKELNDTLDTNAGDNLPLIEDDPKIKLKPGDDFYDDGELEQYMQEYKRSSQEGLKTASFDYWHPMDDYNEELDYKPVVPYNNIDSNSPELTNDELEELRSEFRSEEFSNE